MQSLTKRTADQNYHLPPLQGGSLLDVFPGLKPRAESLSPFGTRSASRYRTEFLHDALGRSPMQIGMNAALEREHEHDG
jgi:hypothetical protein